MGGPITAWTPIGTEGIYEIAHVETVDRFNGMNGCNNGVQVMNSKNGFGVWVWSWGSATAIRQARACFRSTMS